MLRKQISGKIRLYFHCLFRFHRMAYSQYPKWVRFGRWQFRVHETVTLYCDSCHTVFWDKYPPHHYEGHRKYHER